MEAWKRKLRMGMVGGGQGAFVGGVHRMAAALDGQIDFVAGCFSRDPEYSRATGRQLYLDPSRVYATYTEMAEKEARLPPEQRIDFVSIVTPNALHYAVARTFLQAGFHVVCDKPMTASVQEAQDLARLVEQTGLVFALTHNYTGHPLVRHARELFRSGQMGQVRKVIVEYVQDWLMVPQEKLGNKQAMWRADPAQAGPVGAMGDVGTHCESLLAYITGEEIVEVCADFTTFLPGRPLDDDANLLLRFKGGGRGVMTISQVATGEENNLSIKVYASQRGLRWVQENPNVLELYAYGQPRQLLTRAHGEYLSPAATAATRIPVGHPEGYLEAFATIYDGVVEAIRATLDGKPMPTSEYNFPTVYDGLRGMRFVAASLESSRKGSVWVKV